MSCKPLVSHQPRSELLGVSESKGHIRIKSVSRAEASEALKDPHESCASHSLSSSPVGVLGTRAAGARGQTRLGYAHTCAVVSTHPISKMDLLFFTARARHFPPSLVIWFFPSLQRELSTRQPPAGRELGHPHPQHRAPLVPLGGIAFLWDPQQLCPTLPFGRTRRLEETSKDSSPGDGNHLQKLSNQSGPWKSLNDR